MNANSKLPVQTVNSWLQSAATLLKETGITSHQLDAELLLCHALQLSRTWLIAHQNDNIDNANALQKADKMLAKRLERVPIAYLINHKEFYNRSFYVNDSVLIPRPESETIIEMLHEIIPKYSHDASAKIRLIDIGTGSGCLGITAKLEFPPLSVTLSDISEAALTVAKKNAHSLSAKPLRYVQSDLLDHWISHDKPLQFDIIIANLPYVDRAWERSPETNHEPSIALFASDHGLELIKKCIQQASTLTSVNGFLVLEADPEQHAEIIRYASSRGFSLFKAVDYIVALKRH